MVLFDVLVTAKQHLLFSNFTSTGLKGNLESNGLTYAMAVLVMVWHGVKEVLLTFSTNDTIPVLPGNIHTLFFAVNGMKFVGCITTSKHNLAMQKVVPVKYILILYQMGILNHRLVL